MILKGNQRAGGIALAQHLMNAEDNEHITIHELRGFVSDDLHGAFKEVQAISQGTKCKQYLFSLSLNPPENEIVPVKAFERAIKNIEMKMGLVGQSRAIIFHEKEGRRHAHCVWSRIDFDLMKAINLSHYKLKLQDISRQLYLEHQWQMPRGLENSNESDPLNFSHAEYQQSKRTKQDARVLKSIFQKCWAMSDSRTTFANALSEHGFHLAKGDRRGHVAVDGRGEVYAISRWVGIKVKDVRARLGLPDGLPSVEDVKQMIAERFSDKAHNAYRQVEAFHDSQNKSLNAKRTTIVIKHKQAREALHHSRESRKIKEIKVRSARLPKGLKALWLRMAGKYETLKTEIEQDAEKCNERDQAELQRLIEQQLAERRLLQHEVRQIRHHHSIAITKLYRDLGELLQGPNSDIEPWSLQDVSDALTPVNDAHSAFELAADPNQPLVLPDEEQKLFTTNQIRKQPKRILKVITDKQEIFNRNDILRGLTRFISDPIELGLARDQVLKSNDLIEIQSEPTELYTTAEMVQLKLSLAENSSAMAACESHSVKSHHVRTAIRHHNAGLQKSVGTNLGEEQVRAINHLLNNAQISVVVGLAGSGKSTMLAAANEAWTKQGFRVRGAALSGKAADGLQEASDIESRTLASLELSWKNGFNLLEAGDVLVIDEAGMVGTRQMSRFVEEAQRRGAKLVLVGDPEQLQPINAGTPFHDILENIDHASLTEIHRQKEDWQRQATRYFAQNRTEEALETYADHGAVETLPDRSQAIAALIQDYMVDLELRDADTSRLALAYRRKDVHAINQGIRMARKSAGELIDERLFKTKHGPRAFAVGDRILFAKNDMELGVKNGLLGTVESVGKNQLVVCFDTNKKDKPHHLTFSPKRYNFIDHGYATTIHKSQGATVDRTFILSSQKMDRHLTYVAMSRHRETAKLYCCCLNSAPKIQKNQKPLGWMAFPNRRR